MRTMLETGWRQPMWMDMMNHLPASIAINMKTQSYAVKDNSLQFIYADDIDESGVDKLVNEIADQLVPANRREFCKALSMRELTRAWKEERRGYALLSQICGGKEPLTLRTDVVFGQGVREMIMEFRFELFDIHSLLPERVYCDKFTMTLLE